MRIALLTALAVSLAIPGFAQAQNASTAATPAPAEKTAKKPKVDDPNRLVCTREHVVGSNRPQKVCMTVAERAKLKDNADRITDSGRLAVSPTAATE